MYERFMQLLQERNITPYRVSKDTGITQTTLSDWKTGRATPRAVTLQKIADYFGVSLDWLVGNSEYRNLSEYNNLSTDNVYFSFAREAQEEGIDPEDIKEAIEMIKGDVVMSTIDRICVLLKANKKTQKELMDYIGLEKSTFTAWKSKKSTSYKQYVSDIAKFFGVSTDYLLCRTEDPIDYDNDDLLSQIPEEILDHFNYDAKAAYKAWKARTERDIAEADPDFTMKFSEPESKRLYQIIKMAVGKEDAKRIMDTIATESNADNFKVSSSELFWIGLKCNIPDEYLSGIVASTTEINKNEIYSIVEHGIKSPYCFDYSYFMPNWWDNGITKEVYEKRATFSRFEQEVIECEFKYLSKKYSDAQELSWVKEVLNENTVTEPNYRSESKTTVTSSEKAFIDMFNRLTDIDKGRILERMDMLFDEYPPEIKGRVS